MFCLLVYKIDRWIDGWPLSLCSIHIHLHIHIQRDVDVDADVDISRGKKEGGREGVLGTVLYGGTVLNMG